MISQPPCFARLYASLPEKEKKDHGYLLTVDFKEYKLMVFFVFVLFCFCFLGGGGVTMNRIQFHLIF